MFGFRATAQQAVLIDSAAALAQKCLAEFMRDAVLENCVEILNEQKEPVFNSVPK